MVSNVYKTGERSDPQIANYLITRFIGQLKRWWYNNQPIKDEKGEV